MAASANHVGWSGLKVYRALLMFFKWVRFAPGGFFRWRQAPTLPGGPLLAFDKPGIFDSEEEAGVRLIEPEFG